MGVYATVEDVELEWNRPVPDESLAHVNHLIDRAERIVGAAVPNLADRITAGLTTAELVGDVVASMVVRVLRNPDGKRSETAGDYSYELANGDSTGSGLYLTADDRRLLAGRRRAMSIPLVDAALRRPLRKPPLCDRYLHRDPDWEWRS